MEGIKKKLLEELMSKLAEMDDPLMESLKGDSEDEEEGEAEIKVMKIEAEPMDKKKKLKMEV